MDIRNREYEWYQMSVQRQRQRQEDWLRVGYAAPGYALSDFCLFEADGEFHLFYSVGAPGVWCVEGNYIMIAHSTTRNFTQWTPHPPCLYMGGKGWDGAHVFAPYVIEKDGRYWMFYVGATFDNTQRIGLAVSEDLFTFGRAGSRPLIRPGRYGWAFCPSEKGAACRDPHVIKMGAEYWMYYTAVTAEGKGCVARAVSKDLMEWKDAGVVFVNATDSQTESANVQEMEGRYYLFFFCQDRMTWFYAVSETPESWLDAEPAALAANRTAMEVIRRRDRRWLVCYFYSGVAEPPPERMFVGVIDWSEKPVRIQEVHDAAELAEFGFRP